jgi:hypothetical protein
MEKSGYDEYIGTGMVQMNSRLSFRDHRRFTELMHYLGLFVESLTLNGLSGGKLQYCCSDKIDL